MASSESNFSITLGGTAETLLPARLGRSRLIITPVTEDCWIRFGAVAAPNVGELLYMGSPGQWSVENFPELGASVSVYSATTASKINIREA